LNVLASLGSERGGLLETEHRGMGASERRKWSSLVRQDIQASVLSVLADEDMHGVVVVGAQGVGKSTFARAVEAQLVGHAHIVHLHGTSTDPAIPFGQLAFLVARLPGPDLASPGEIVHGISRLIREDAAGRPVLVVLEDLPAIDSMSTAVLMQLLLSGAAKLMVTVRNITDMPEDLIRLLRNRSLEEVRLEAFSRAEVAKLLSGVLGRPVTATAASALYASSAGNPLVLQAIVIEQLRSGNLHLAGKVWALKGGINLAAADALVDLVRSRLARETPRVREGLEWLALIRRVPLLVLLDVLDPAVVADLEKAGYLRVGDSERRWVSLKDEYVGEVIRGWMDLPRRKELHRLVATVVGATPGDMDEEELLGYVAWTLDCREPVEPAFALAAAAAANRLFDPVFALECLGQIHADDPHWAEAAQQRAAAYSTLAEHESAVAVLEEVTAEQLSQLPAAAYAKYTLDFCSALLWVPGGYDRIGGIISAARRELARRERASIGNETPDDFARANELVRLAEFELKVHQGEYAAVADDLELSYRAGGDPLYVLNCACLLTMAWAILGREAEAIALAGEVQKEMEKTGASPGMLSWRSEGLFAALLCSGHWEDCVRILTDALDQKPKIMQHLGGAAELALGVAYTYAGRADLAIDTLLGAQAQLEIRRSYYGPALACSALAFAYAQAGDIQESRNFLDLAAQEEQHVAWFTSWMAEFCVRMARRWLKDPGAKQKLLESAHEDISKDRTTTASISLFGATVHGTDEELALLTEVSSRRQGKMASVNRLVGEGSRKKDSKILLEAASLAHELHLDAVESRCVVLALDIARDRGDSQSARAAQHRLDRLVETLPVLPLMPHTVGPELTERERQVAKMASQGLSNKEVANRLQLSIRTVEGHLYQIFTKMGISSRSELEGTAQV
jgi:DNA-binding CsgD family transcriptional regulator/tetratricopeptide (TPR) repeat protein